MRIIRGRFKRAAIFSFLALSFLHATPPTVLGPQLVGNASGVVAMWSAFSDSSFAIYQAKLPVSGSWSAPVAISTTDKNCLYPALSMNSGGTILAIWQRSEGTSPDIQIAMNTFSDLSDVTICTPSFFSAQKIPCSSPHVCLDNSGNGTFALEGRNSSGYVMLCTECTTANLRAPLVSISATNTHPTRPDIAVKASSGEAFGVWQENASGVQTIVAGNITLEGGILGPVAISASGVNSASPALAVSSNGDVYAAWWQASSPNCTLQITAIADDLSVSPSTLSLVNTDLTVPKISANASGDLLLVCRAYSADGNSAVATAAYTDGAWSDVAILSDASTTSVAGAVVCLNDAGQGVAIWQDTSSDNGCIWVAQYSSGTWGTPLALSSSSLNCSAPALYLDPTGYAVASWTAQTGTDTITSTVQSATLASFSGSWSAPSTISSP